MSLKHKRCTVESWAEGYIKVDLGFWGIEEGVVKETVGKDAHGRPELRLRSAWMPANVLAPKAALSKAMAILETWEGTRCGVHLECQELHLEIHRQGHE